MENRDILLQLIQHYTNGNKAAFAKLIGISPNGLSTWLSRNKIVANKIIANCEGVNPAFLLTGEGPITLDAGVPTPTASSVPPVQSLNNQNIDQRINELLAISSTLQQQFQAINERLAEATAIIKKSQEQFDRVLALHDSQENENKKSDHTYYGMVAEDIK